LSENKGRDKEKTQRIYTAALNSFIVAGCCHENHKDKPPLLVKIQNI
jgi:hypothetical protein